MIAVYFTGASGTGKTTLAKYVEEEYGLTRLPSAARTALAKLGYEDKSFLALHADQEKFHEFQLETNRQQYQMERLSRFTDMSYVSDRCFDHLIYAAHYGIKAHEIANSGIMYEYMKNLVAKNYNFVIFHVRPTHHVLIAAIKDGDRMMFLNWEAMQRFDGAVKFVLESTGLAHTEISTPSLAERKTIIDMRLAELGIPRIKK